MDVFEDIELGEQMDDRSIDLYIKKITKKASKTLKMSIEAAMMVTLDDLDETNYLNLVDKHTNQLRAVAALFDGAQKINNQRMNLNFAKNNNNNLSALLETLDNYHTEYIIKNSDIIDAIISVRAKESDTKALQKYYNEQLTIVTDVEKIINELNQERIKARININVRAL